MVRGGQHRRAVQHESVEEKNKLYTHFSSGGHSVNDMLFYAIETVQGDNFTLQARERDWIDKLCSVYNSKRAKPKSYLKYQHANSNIF